ncbi:MAG: serine hydroxymethyltransferase [Myxococcota bacterium]
MSGHSVFEQIVSLIGETDPEVAELIQKEEQREQETIRLIASENYASRAVMGATGSIFTNKYCEGYAGKRYYLGQEVTDMLERLTIARAKELYGAEHVNVQPYSGSPANFASFLAVADPGDTILGMDLPHGGHLTHGWKVNFSGRLFQAVHYQVSRDTELLDYDQIRELALKHRPKILIAGHSAYPRQLDFGTFAEIAREVDAVFLTDMAHISGLVAGGAHPSPVPHSDIVTTTTHKSLRGPRSGMVLCKDQHAKAIDRAIFPGAQGGPHMHAVAALAVALHEALQPEFKVYAQQIVDNARAMAAAFAERGYRLVTGGTDNHIVLVDLTPKGVGGKPASIAMEKAGIVCNYNTIPYDTRKPFDPSGIRIGTPAVTTRGMGEAEMVQIVDWIDRAILGADDDAALRVIRGEVREFCATYPAP